jgi:hypothetical protein
VFPDDWAAFALYIIGGNSTIPQVYRIYYNLQELTVAGSIPSAVAHTEHARTVTIGGNSGSLGGGFHRTLVHDDIGPLTPGKHYRVSVVRDADHADDTAIASLSVTGMILQRAA